MVNPVGPRMLPEPKVLVVIPAFNEEESIEGVVREVQSCQPKFDIIVVNDASTDLTAPLAKSLGVKVASLPFNLGIGGAVQTGFKYAKQCGYDIVVQVDADGQHDAAFLPDLVGPIIRGETDISVGSRFLHNGNSKPPFVRNIGIHFFSWLTSKMASQRITDCSSGFRALNRRSFEYFADSYPVDFPDAEALIAAHRAGLRVFETPVKFRTRNSGSSSLRTWRMVYYPIKEVFSIVMMGTRKRDSL